MEGKESAGLCAGGCGHFGSAATNGYCSQCYKDYCSKLADGSLLPSGAAPVAAPAGTTASAGTAAASDGAGTGAGAGAGVAAVTATSKSAAAEATAASAGGTGSDGPRPRKRQKNKSRCWTCRKKVGLTGFECKCSYVFCGEHRYAEMHSCDFDYKTMQRDLLSAANQKVAAAKLDRV